MKMFLYIYLLSLLFVLLVNVYCSFYLKNGFKKIGKFKEYVDYHQSFKKTHRKGLKNKCKYLILICPIINVLLSIVQIININKVYLEVQYNISKLNHKEVEDENSH